MDLHLPISSLALRKFAKSKIQPSCQEFKASRGWLQKLIQRHGDALRRRTSISQMLPKQLEEKLSDFYETCARFLKIENMDEMLVFFDIVLNKSFAEKGSKSVHVKTSGFE